MWHHITWKFLVAKLLEKKVFLRTMDLKAIVKSVIKNTI